MKNSQAPTTTRIDRILPLRRRVFTSIVFTWDSRKAAANRKKHGVTFEEATTVFGDPLSITIPEPVHSLDEIRFIIVGRSQAQRLLVVVHVERGDRIRIISARSARRKGAVVAEMMKEYDFSRGIRGKYARRFAPGSRAVVLDPDVGRVFPDSKSVNEVLRALAPVLRRRRRKAS
jgi:uncharacterized DUF497 family protein